MARLTDFDDLGRDYYERMPMPSFTTTPWAVAKPIHQARIAMISTAGLQRRGDRPFAIDSADYRLIPGDVAAADLVMSHISTNFDRTGFQEDHNVVLPIDRLNDLVRSAEVGAAASVHYSFMGATHPDKLERTARTLAGLLKRDKVDAVLLIPV